MQEGDSKSFSKETEGKVNPAWSAEGNFKVLLIVGGAWRGEAGRAFSPRGGAVEFLAKFPTLHIIYVHLLFSTYYKTHIYTYHNFQNYYNLKNWEHHKDN